MTKIKTALAVFLAFLMILAFTGCGEDEAPVSAEAPDTLIGESGESQDSAGTGLDGDDLRLPCPKDADDRRERRNSQALSC